MDVPESLEGSDAGADQPAPVIYRVNLRRVPFAEFRAGASMPAAVLAWLLVRVFRVTLPTLPVVESIRECESSLEAMPESMGEKYAAAAADLATLGFRKSVCYWFEDNLQGTGLFLVTFAHPTIPVVAMVAQRQWPHLRSPVTTELMTMYADGGVLSVSSVPTGVPERPNCRVVRRPGASPLDLWKLYEQERALQPSSRRPVRAATDDDIRAIGERQHNDYLKKKIASGEVRRWSAEEEARSLALRQVRTQGAAASRHADVIVELERVQRKQSSWTGAIVILLVSLVVFLAVGLPGQGSFLRLLALVPILLFHEAGHYLAMRMSGYRNLRMFFVPGFGAAVTGRAFNVPGWKKVFVSLMGPVPGVVVGIIVGLCGLVWGKPLAIEAGTLLLLLNGFNLLPVLPLDGGHVLHAVLFSRHAILDVVFRGLAVAALLGLSIALNTRVFMFVGIALAVGLPLAARTAMTARALRREGLRPISPDDQSIPPDVAERIIDRIKANAKKPMPTRAVAMQTLQVFETLNTRPPGVLASLGLLSVHAVSLVAAVVFTVLFIVGKDGNLMDLLRSARSTPAYSLKTSDVRTSGTPGNEGEFSTVVATFRSAEAAASALNEASTRFSPDQTGAVLGRTVLLRIPVTDDAARKQWIADLTPRAEDVFVDGGTAHAAFRFQAIAPNEAAAKELLEEIGEYTDVLLDEPLAAPWSTGSRPTPRQRLARRTYARILQASPYDDAEAVALREKVIAARRAGDREQVAALDAEYETLLTTLRQAELKGIAEDESLHTELASQYLALEAAVGPDEVYELAPHLGPAPPGDRTTALAGYATRKGLLIRIEYLTLRDPSVGAPAVVSWLAARGCTGLRYDVEMEADYDEDEEG